MTQKKRTKITVAESNSDQDAAVLPCKQNPKAVKTTGVPPLHNCPFSPFFCHVNAPQLCRCQAEKHPKAASASSSSATHLVCGPELRRAALILITHDQRWAL